MTTGRGLGLPPRSPASLWRDGQADRTCAHRHDDRVAVIVYLLWRAGCTGVDDGPPRTRLAFAAAPYVIYVAQYGARCRNDAGTGRVRRAGSSRLRLGRSAAPIPARLLRVFRFAFLANWMPTLAPRNTFQYAMLAIPVAALGCAAAGVVLSLQRMWRKREERRSTSWSSPARSDLPRISRSTSSTATNSMLRPVGCGAYPRYYLPLAAIVPLAGLPARRRVEAPRWRAGLLTFLIAGPILFRFLGAPLG